jgi:hypothetical protein
MTLGDGGKCALDSIIRDFCEVFNGNALNLQLSLRKYSAVRRGVTTNKISQR